MLNISVLVSGGGTNLQAIIDGIESGLIPDAQIVRIIASNSKAFALERGRKHGIETRVIGRENFPDDADPTDKIMHAIVEETKAAGTDLIVLAGYMSVLNSELVKAYEGRIINIHPSLIPKFCGKGFYGIRVHRAVIEAGEKESGATVHFVDEGVDTGKIILQDRVPVLEGDTPEDLAARVLTVEHRILPEVIKRIAKGEIKI